MEMNQRISVLELPEERRELVTVEPSHPAGKHPTAYAYLKAILLGILPRPESLQIEQETAGEVLVLIIRVPQEDRRYVVGKKGRNIEAIRDLVRAYGGRQGQSIVIKLSEESIQSEVNDERSERDPRTKI